jgi:hypothetical protein
MKSWLRVPIHGGSMLIDLADWPLYAANKWYAKQDHKGAYAARTDNRAKRTIRFHREVNRTPARFETDHRNGDKLDNRSDNLRTGTSIQNRWNRERPSTNTSGYKGVYQHPVNRTWVAQISANGSQKYLGSFRSAEAAAHAYNQAAVRLHGPFAWINVIKETI